jgi:hypothetical protein
MQWVAFRSMLSPRGDWQVKGSGYGLDVVVRIDHLRCTAHPTREEIWRQPRAESVIQLWERHVQHPLAVYRTVLRPASRISGRCWHRQSSTDA